MATTTQSAQAGDALQPQAPQLLLLDFFFPGISVLTGAVQKYLHIDLNVYIPALLMLGAGALSWRYFSEYFWDQVEQHFMSHVDCPTNDETYNFLMNWVAAQSFAKRARRFMVNTNLNSRSWFIWSWDDDEDDSDDETTHNEKSKKKALQYTPTFGSHYFWYRGRLLIFRRQQNQNRNGFVSSMDKEEISLSCFGRDPWILKQLLLEARDQFMKKDETKTLIYRGTSGTASDGPSWQRSMARASRPLSTVILNSKVKQDLIDDVTDYLNPATRRWYSNRGIPYRRGYLLFGPPGTGKSSLSLALAGYFKMRIYIVSLNSITSNEENLASLFADLPRRCVVLLEDIDTAGLTHTRADGTEPVNNTPAPPVEMVPGQLTPGNDTATPSGRLSLSGLLNILDGVASQEGRVLIMTTNHLEKLDKALIRPGRVDRIVHFDLADADMTRQIFTAIFAPLEGDGDTPAAPLLSAGAGSRRGSKQVATAAELEAEEERLKKEAADKAKEMAEILARVERLADVFASKMPAHEFSPAELQGYLLKNKRDPQAAVDGVDEWVVETRKEKKEKEIKDAEEKRKAAEEKKKKDEEEKKKKEEEEKKKKDEEEKEKRKEERRKQRAKSSRRKSRKSKKAASESDTSSDSDSDSEADEKKEKQRKPSRASSSLEDAKPKEAAVVADDKPANTSETVAQKDTATEVAVVTIPGDQAVKDVTTVTVEKKEVEEVKHDSGYGTP